MLTLIQGLIKEANPRAIVATFKEVNGEPNFEEDTLPGKWYRVYPKTAKDVFFLSMLDHRRDKFAPASGCGVLIHPRCLMVP